MDFGFDALGWTEVIHTIGQENVRSIALAQQLGSTNGGPTQPPIRFRPRGLMYGAKILLSAAAALFGAVKRDR